MTSDLTFGVTFRSRMTPKAEVTHGIPGGSEMSGMSEVSGMSEMSRMSRTNPKIMTPTSLTAGIIPPPPIHCRTHSDPLISTTPTTITTTTTTTEFNHRHRTKRLFSSESEQLPEVVHESPLPSPSIVTQSPISSSYSLSSSSSSSPSTPLSPLFSPPSVKRLRRSPSSPIYYAPESLWPNCFFLETITSVDSTTSTITTPTKKEDFSETKWWNVQEFVRHIQHQMMMEEKESKIQIHSCHCNSVDPLQITVYGSHCNLQETSNQQEQPLHSTLLKWPWIKWIWVSPSHEAWLCHGSYSSTGCRKQNEDRILVVPKFYVNSNQWISCYVVFDGHGGSDAVNWFSQWFLSVFSIYYTSHDLKRSISVPEAIRCCLQDLEREFKLRYDGSVSGTTMTGVMVDEIGHMWSWNIGDSLFTFRVVNSNNNNNIEKPSINPISMMVHRTASHSISFPMTRCLGNVCEKRRNPLITAEPDIQLLHPLNPSSMLALMTDGAWDPIHKQKHDVWEILSVYVNLMSTINTHTTTTTTTTTPTTIVPYESKQRYGLHDLVEYQKKFYIQTLSTSTTECPTEIQSGWKEIVRLNSSSSLPSSLSWLSPSCRKEEQRLTWICYHFIKHVLMILNGKDNATVMLLTPSLMTSKINSSVMITAVPLAHKKVNVENS